MFGLKLSADMNINWLVFTHSMAERLSQQQAWERSDSSDPQGRTFGAK